MAGRARAALVLAGLAHLGQTLALARDLTFEQRVAAQRSIERISYVHQIGSTRPFEEAVPRSALEQKVRTYLKETVALARFWKTRVTNEMLRRETERMAGMTRMPDRLREIFAALGDDPFLIQECLARPVLVDRLVRSFFASDQTIHAEARRRAEALRRDLLSAGVGPWHEHPDRAVVEVVRIGPGEEARGDATGPSISWRRRGSRLEVPPDEFDRWRRQVPGRVGEIGPLLDEEEAFAVRVLLEERPGRLRVAMYVVWKRSWDDWWREVQADLEETSVRAVAPSDVFLPTPGARAGDQEVAGDASAGASSADAILSSDPSACRDNTWIAASLSNLPEARFRHTAVWTGNEVLSIGV